MLDARDFLELGLAFHGHKCPAMPLGLRAAVAAMNALGVERARDKELHVVSETGKGHAASCFLDGVMVVTGCTYGKSNVEKRYYNKIRQQHLDRSGQKETEEGLRLVSALDRSGDVSAPVGYILRYATRLPRGKLTWTCFTKTSPFRRSFWYDLGDAFGGDSFGS